MILSRLSTEEKKNKSKQSFIIKPIIFHDNKNSHVSTKSNNHWTTRGTGQHPAGKDYTFNPAAVTSPYHHHHHQQQQQQHHHQQYQQPTVLQQLYRTLALERHSISAMSALCLFCLGVYAMWTIVEETWYLIGTVLFRRWNSNSNNHDVSLPLSLLQFITSLLLARINGWMWWNFLNETEYSVLVKELQERKNMWDVRILNGIYGTTVSSFVSVISYISCFLAISSLFQHITKWSTSKFSLLSLFVPILVVLSPWKSFLVLIVTSASKISVCSTA